MSLPLQRSMGNPVTIADIGMVCKTHCFSIKAKDIPFFTCGLEQAIALEQSEVPALKDSEHAGRCWQLGAAHTSRALVTQADREGSSSHSKGLSISLIHITIALRGPLLSISTCLEEPKSKRTLLLSGTRKLSACSQENPPLPQEMTTPLMSSSYCKGLGNTGRQGGEAAHITRALVTQVDREGKQRKQQGPW